MRPWLALDTATDTASVAIHDGAVRYEATWTSRRRHTQQLAPIVSAALRTCGLAVGDLGGIAVALGPGSYTGLRISLALAKGLALGSGVRLVGVPTLDILAAALSPPHTPRDVPLWAVLRAGRGRIVAARYPATTTGEGWPDPATLSVQTVDAFAAESRGPGWVAGEIDAVARERFTAAGLTVLPPAASVRRGGWLAELGRARADRAADPVTLSPIYLGGG